MAAVSLGWVPVQRRVHVRLEPHRLLEQSLVGHRLTWWSWWSHGWWLVEQRLGWWSTGHLGGAEAGGGTGNRGGAGGAKAGGGWQPMATVMMFAYVL